ncbi:carboxymuconolactone decarboxylase family protein [Sphingobacterium faecale]|uniref:Carboxymuconolactone decarboxylase family protein n=1 Tax=Sphingobacterium faecale TaxID=2803775 RepID=A0ABS1R5F5_9SPHI|nr:carboxymuconolactone decarboxylase family protein [Sphingobacterium faecale]MBL1409933.1 carboxymuconolactone decarboxylase family protein [Sphingobacterium faecale]
MDQRLNLPELDPKAFQVMLGIEKYLAESGLDKKLQELIKIRASQINGCAFCLNMHTRDALKIGETAQRIFLLNAWKETDLFTENEKAVLALTEAITLIAKGPVSDEVYNSAKVYFTDKELAVIMMAIVAINSWNRITITSRTPLD